MNFEINPRTVFLVVSGSRAYGINNADSDWDYRGIAISPLDIYFGLKPKFEHLVDGGPGKKHVYKHFPEGLLQPDSDMQILELVKFCALAIDCNPSIIEILFTDPKFYVRDPDPIMKRILENKHKFLNQQVKARFCGYALSQINRVKRHRRWLLNPVLKQPQRADFNLPDYKLISLDQLGAAEALIQKEINEFMIDQTEMPDSVKIELTNGLGKMMRAIWSSLHQTPYPVGEGQKFASTEDALAEAVAREQGFSENFIEVLKREKQYRGAKQEWNSYQTWLKERNPKRAELEKKCGYDSKHVAHCFRLLGMAREIITTGQVLVHRPDAERLKEIRNGILSYEEVVEFAEKESEALNELIKTSSLPKNAPVNEIHEMLVEAIMQFNLVKTCDEQMVNKMIKEILKVK